MNQLLHDDLRRIPGLDGGTQVDRTGRDPDGRERRLFRSLDLAGRGQVVVSTLLGALEQAGISRDDPRLEKTLSSLSARNMDDALEFEAFCETVRPSILLIERALQGNVVIPCFDSFREGVDELVDETLSNVSGDVARYIPQLARVDPDSFALAMCTVDGQRYYNGAVSTPFSVQSCCKPVNYCLALEEHGEEQVHALIGCEPNGGLFNELALTAEGRPHNPMINAGAILSTSLIRPRLPLAERFEYVLDRWSALSGGRRPGFSNAVYQSERRTADRNYAIAYYMREHQAFPPDVDMQETLELYFQCCSIELDVDALSVVAATLANGGVCPFTGERLIQAKNVQNCLSLMCSCGMYDFSGEFAFTVGLPAKSGVSGAVLVVVPNVLGFCVWSPRLDRRGNSVRGVEFCQRLVRKFNLHNFDSLTGASEKVDPRADPIREKAEQVGELIWAASRGDLGAVQRLGVRGVDVNTEDYDGRTALHLASAEGRIHVVRDLVAVGARVNPRDRWGGTPLDDARRHGHRLVEEYLETVGAEGGRGADVVNAPSPPSGAREPRDVVELIYAASAGELTAIQRLVARGVDLEGADYDLRTPLHLAAAEGHERVVRYFLDQGVRANPRDRWGGTPLDDAVRHGHDGVAELLRTRSRLRRVGVLQHALPQPCTAPPGDRPRNLGSGQWSP